MTQPKQTDGYAPSQRPAVSGTCDDKMHLHNGLQIPSAAAVSRKETIPVRTSGQAAATWFPAEFAAPTIRLVRLINSGRGKEVPTQPKKDSATTPRAFSPNEFHVLLAMPSHGEPAISLLCDSVRACGYPTECLAPRSRQQLASALQQYSNSVVVIHTDLLKVIALPHLLALRRQYPAALWILAWPTPAPEWAELVVKFEARGCVDCDDLSTLKRAIDSVIAGNLWFPRWLAQALYFNLLARADDGCVDMSKQAAPAEQGLTAREMQALQLMQRGMTNKEIAWRLQVTVNTVKKHLKHAFEKLGTTDRHSESHPKCGCSSHNSASDPF